MNDDVDHEGREAERRTRDAGAELKKQNHHQKGGEQVQCRSLCARTEPAAQCLAWQCLVVLVLQFVLQSARTWRAPGAHPRHPGGGHAHGIEHSVCMCIEYML